MADGVTETSSLNNQQIAETDKKQTKRMPQSR